MTNQEIIEALDKINKRLDKLESFKIETIKDINAPTRQNVPMSTADVINQIKNRKMSGVLSKEKIRPQFRDFMPYAENVRLFKLIDTFNSQLYAFRNAS